MNMSRFLLLVLALPVCAQDRATKESATSRLHDLGAILDTIAKDIDRACEKPNDRVLVVWMIDNSSALKSTRHNELFSDHIARAFMKQKVGVHHAVFTFAERPQLVMQGTADSRAPGRAIEWMASQKPDDKIKNLCANIRAGASYAAGFSGKKFLIVWTPENADNEDNVEATLKMLRDTGVVLYAIADEATYSDPYWESMLAGTAYYGDSNKYKKLKFDLKGPESAYIEFPYGWLLVAGDPAYTVPSGFGYWALNRLATHSNGEYYLYASGASSSLSFCARWACTTCGGLHKACGAHFNETKLKFTAPSIESRDEVRARLSRERLSVAIYAAWEKLFRAGLVRNSGPLKASGGGLSETKPQISTTSPLAFTNDWRQGRNVCKKLLGDLDRIVEEFADTLEKLGPEADHRSKATGDAFLVHLKLLRFNVDQLRTFCEELEQHEKSRHGPEDGKGFGSDSFDDT